MRAYTPQSSWLEKNWFVILLLLLAGALLLRLIDIGDSLWLDESFTLLFLRQYSTWGLITELPVDDVHPPFYYLLVKPVFEILGEGELSLRFISIVTGAAAAPVTAEIGRRMHSHQSGVTAGAVTAIAPYQVMFGQEARMYALLIFLTSLSYLALLRYISEASLYNLSLYVIASFCMAMTHVFGYFVIVSQNFALFLIIAYKLEKSALQRSFESYVRRLFSQSWTRRWIVGQILLVGLTSPYTAILLTKAQTGHGARDAAPMPIELFSPLIQYFGPLPETGLNYLLAAGICTLILVAVIPTAVRAGFRWPSSLLDGAASWQDVRSTLILLPWATIPIGLPFVVSYLVRPIYMVRYTAPASLGMYLLVAIGISRLRNQSVQVLLVALLLVVSMVPLYGVYQTNQRGNWEQATTLIEKNTDASDELIYLESNFTVTALKYYYDGSLPVVTREDTAENDQLPSQARQADSLWVVLSYTGAERHQQVLNRFNTTHSQTSCTQFPRIYVCEYD